MTERYTDKGQAKGTDHSTTRQASDCGNRHVASSCLSILIAAEQGSFDSSLKCDLERSGHMVTQVFSPFEMVSRLRASKIDLVITDLYPSAYCNRSIIELCRLAGPLCRLVVSASWGRDLVRRTIPPSEIDLLVSSSCRYEEVRDLLDRMSTTAGENHYE